MRVIVRLLLRLVISAGAAVVIVLVAGWAADARADTTLPDLAGAGAPPANPSAPPAPAPPDVPAPPTVPPAPQPPTVTAPSPPALPGAPDLSPESILPASPGLPADVPPPPAPSPPPDAPGVGLETITDALGELPGVPSFTPPDAAELPALPELPVPTLPSEAPEPPAPSQPASGPIEPGVVSDARTAAANTTALGPTESTPEPLHASDTGRAEGDSLFAEFVRSSAPARAPPVSTSRHSCPGGGGPSSGRATPVGLVPPGADDATRRASLLFGSRAYASSNECDPLLRPD
jgi:hypothetical protein